MPVFVLSGKILIQNVRDIFWITNELIFVRTLQFCNHFMLLFAIYQIINTFPSFFHIFEIIVKTVKETCE